MDPFIAADPQLALQAAGPPRPPAETRDPARARETAQEFESLFLSQMLEHMFTGIETDGLFGGGHAEKVYRSMLFQEFGRAISRAGGVGIADMVQREILKTQEVE